MLVFVPAFVAAAFEVPRYGANSLAISELSRALGLIAEAALARDGGSGEKLAERMAWVSVNCGAYSYSTSGRRHQRLISKRDFDL